VLIFVRPEQEQLGFREEEKDGEFELHEQHSDDAKACR